MTASRDYDGDFGGPNHPVFLGIAMTPMILGILAGISGLALACAAWNFVIEPLQRSHDQLQLDVQTKQEKLARQDQIEKDLKKAKADLVIVNKQRDQVMALFAKEKDLNTLLLDVNQLIEKNNSGILAAKEAKLNSCPGWVREQYSSIAKSQTFEDQVGPIIAEARLTKFQPSDKGIETITAVGNDSYMQPALVNKLRRQTVDIAFQGNFSQTQSIFRTIERLQPLLIVKNLKIGLNQGGAKTGGLYETGPGDAVRFLTNCQPETLITTSFKVDALLPLAAVAAPKAGTPAGAAASPGASPSASPSPGASPAASPAASPSASPK
jgi:type IV pilus assembly protein PilO